MNILLLGKTGQVSSEIQKIMDVNSFDRNDFNFLDLKSCEKILDNINTDIIINTVAYTDVEGAENNEELATIINGDAPGIIANIAKKKNIPFIHFSTDYVFDGSGSNFWKPLDAINPLSAYGRSKAKGEKNIIEIDGFFIIIRTSWVFSSFKNNFVKKILKSTKDKKFLTIVDDQFGGPTSAFDLANVCKKIVNKLICGQGKKGIYHYAGQPNINRADFVREILKLSNFDILVKGVSSKNFNQSAIRPLNSRLDCSDIERVYDIKRSDWRVDLHYVLKDILKF